MNKEHYYYYYYYYIIIIIIIIIIALVNECDDWVTYNIECTETCLDLDLEWECGCHDPSTSTVDADGITCISMCNTIIISYRYEVY